MISVSSAQEKSKRVKAKFMGPLALALAFIMCVFAIAIFGIETYTREQDLAGRSTAVERLFSQKLDKDTNLMMATIRAMFADEALAGAFARGDRKLLAELGDPLFKVLREEHRISHLYLIRPDFVSLYRYHSPGEFGDRIDRVSLLQARDRQVPTSGLELGTMGTLTLRLVVPWRHAGHLIGYIEIGEEIEHLIEEMRHALSVDLLVLLEKHVITREQWQRGQALMRRVGDWDRFASHAALAQTTDRLPAALDHGLLDRLLAGRTAELRDQGRSLHLAIVPLEDAGKRHIGELVVMRDITDLAATFQWSIFAVTVISLLAGGGVLGIFYIALGHVERDYQRQHDLEHQLLRLDTEHRRILQLEKLSAVGTMVGGIAHQLNNPLVGVVNLAQLAERDADDPARTRELLREIRSAGEDCRAFVKRMLAFSKVSGFESRPTPMSTLIEDTVLLFRQTERRHLQVDTQLPEPPVVLNVDPVLLRHALFNLLVNAAQATAGADGVIRIELTAQDDPSQGVHGWSLAVADQGCGMSPEVLAHVFEPFYTTRSDGTGLGLPVVQHVALLHDGNVTVTSEPGHGTRFAIWLPDTQMPST